MKTETKKILALVLFAALLIVGITIATTRESPMERTIREVTEMKVGIDQDKYNEIKDALEKVTGP